MKKLGILLTITAFSFSALAQIDLNKALKNAKDQTDKTLNGGNKDNPLTNDEVIGGLKEALTVGTRNSTASASKIDGFYRNPAIKIPFPPEAAAMKSTLENIGMKSQVDKFVQTLNRAAEEASKDAAPIFINAVKSMTINDGFAILKGADNAATQYLSKKTSAELMTKFKPIIKQAIQKVEVTKYWNPLVTKYNKIPGVKKQNPNLEDYVTKKALEGLFKLLADEELKIRKDPVARVSDILKKVFGSIVK